MLEEARRKENNNNNAFTYRGKKISITSHLSSKNMQACKQEESEVKQTVDRRKNKAKQKKTKKTPPT